MVRQSKLSKHCGERQKERFRERVSETFKEDGFFRAVGHEFDAECMRPVAKFLLTTTITHIILDHNPLGDEGTSNLAKAIGNLGLRELSLVSVNMGNKGGLAVLKALQ